MLSITENSVSESMIKSAIIDMMNNNRDFFKELVIEAIEDIGMIAAMKEVDERDIVREESIMELLSV
jgi:hypothetical protein